MNSKDESLKGIECINASCVCYVPGEGYWCIRYNDWAGICQRSHSQRDGERKRDEKEDLLSQ